MKSQFVAILVLMGGVVSCLGALDGEQTACYYQYKEAVGRVELPADVLAFIDSEAQSGETPAGCQELYRVNQQILVQVPCAEKLLSMYKELDKEIMDDLASDKQVALFNQATTDCFVSEYGYLANQGQLYYV